MYNSNVNQLIVYTLLCGVYKLKQIAKNFELCSLVQAYASIEKGTVIVPFSHIKEKSHNESNDVY